MKIAIVHDWLTSPGGAERVLEQMLVVYPEADIFTVCDFLEPQHRHYLRGKEPQTTFIQHLPFAKTSYRSYLPLMPLAIEQFELNNYDLILSSSYAVAKGVIVAPNQVHVSYIHTPIRYAWHLQAQYLRESGLNNGIRSWTARLLLHYLRTWDLSSAAGVDVFVSNSAYVAKQVNRLYQQECKILYPPVDSDAMPFVERKQDFFVTASRLVPYKRIDLIVRAFTKMPSRKLVVVGEGPERARLEKSAQGYPNIEILGYQPISELRRLLSEAQAFIFAAIEDFGITPVEAQACGTPVIAFAKGGILESIRGGDGHEPRTGIFYHEQTEEAIVQAVESFVHQADTFEPANCRANAERFTAEKFRLGLAEIVDTALRQQ